MINAEEARILPPPQDSPDEEVVLLLHPMFCSYKQDEKKVYSPAEFFVAREAELHIRQGDDAVELWAQLRGGVKVPRRPEGSTIAGLEAVEFGPVRLPSPVQDTPRFMTNDQLKRLYRNPTGHREVRNLHAQVLRQTQELKFLEMVQTSLKTGSRESVFENTGGESYTIALKGGARIRPPKWGESKLVLFSPAAAADVWLARTYNKVSTVDKAREMVVTAQSDLERHVMWLEFDIARTAKRPFSVPTPPELRSDESLTPEQYLNKTGLRNEEATKLDRKVRNLQAEIVAEIHGRGAFAVGCLILVVIGCAIGMTFRAGDYLSAFALSVVPALICILLIATGSHVSQSDYRNMRLGLGLIWGGNVAVFGLAAWLLGRLQRY